MKIPSQTSPDVMIALDQLKNEDGDKFNQVFKSITSDNGAEFSGLSTLESTGCQIYFTHPYASGERGTNENHNEIIRRFIPKEKLMEDVSIEILGHVQEWMNTLSRKILNDLTPEELFEDFLD